MVIKLKELNDKARHPKILDKYSPWLSKFQWCGEENYLEFPGQYTGDSCPIQSEHIKIIKFDEKILIFHSLRMPIKIKIYGSNGQTYPYLVKYGDDMRQDERIQHIFHHMSDLLKSDEKCRNHRLNIKGYRVVPINVFCGFLSFVEHTTSIFELVRQGLEKKIGSADKIDECRQEYMKFLKVHSIGEKDQNNIHLYGRSILNYNRTQVLISPFCCISSTVTFPFQFPRSSTTFGIWNTKYLTMSLNLRCLS